MTIFCPSISANSICIDKNGVNPTLKIQDSDIEDEPEPASKSARMRVPSIFDWQKDLLAIIKNISGLERINCTSKPSTAAVGNWAVIQCIQRMSELSSLGSSGFDCRLFMGKKTTTKQKIDFALTKKDSSDTIAAQWDGLRFYLLDLFNRISNHISVTLLNFSLHIRIVVDLHFLDQILR